ncbi:MAG: hypothetical protein MJ147_04790 [Clostridia bacterium]|nr:hypothetical protein [Clostridia bacterium]
MVNELDVYEVLKHLTAVDSTQEIIDLCAQCFESIVKELKSGTDTDDPRILNAAAAKAFYLLCVKEKSAQTGGEITSFKAGDLSVSQKSSEAGSKLEAARKLYESELKKLTPLYEDTGFFAGKVDIT